MKKLRRFLCFALLLMLTALSLTACHGTRGTAEFVLPEEFDESKEYEITFWAKNDTNKAQSLLYQQTIDEFESYYPNIRVNLRLYTNYGDIYNDVITNIATRTTPNVCITYPDHVATYLAGSNVVAPLDALLTSEKYGLGGSAVKFDSVAYDEVVPEYLSEGNIGEHCYTIPYMRSTEACYVNKTYVEKLGYKLPDTLTWDFIWEVSEAAMAQNADGTFAVNGQKVMIPFIYKSTDNMLIQMLRQKGAGYSDEEGDILLFNDETEDILKTIAQHAQTRAFSTFKISSYPANFLNAGQCIFAVDSTAGSTWMGSDAPLCDISPDKLVSFETAVRMVPQYDPEHPQMISQGPSVCIFNKDDPQEVLASWLFAQFLLTDGVQIPYAQTEGYIPVTVRAQQNPDYQDYLARGGEDKNTHYAVKIEATQLLLDHIEDTFVTPVFNGSASLRDAAGQLIENVVKSCRRGETVDDAYFEKLYSDVNSLYRLDQTGAAATGQEDLGPLPATAKALLAVIAAAWIGILAYVLIDKAKAKNT